MVPSLPHITDLHTEDDLDQTRVLDYLFEPSPAIHSLLLPVIRTAEYNSYSSLVDACQIRLLSLAAASPETNAAAAAAAAVRPSSTTNIQPPTPGADGEKARPDPLLLAVLGSHPRLGEKKIDSATSAAEQANIQRGQDENQAEELLALNREYEETFPGLRYVVFVNGRGRADIMSDMRKRIERRDYTKEVAGAIQAMSDIAKDRAAKASIKGHKER